MSISIKEVIFIIVLVLAMWKTYDVYDKPPWAVKVQAAAGQGQATAETGAIAKPVIE